MILEAMAQAAACSSFSGRRAHRPTQNVYYFAGIDGARFKRPVSRATSSMLDVELERMLRGICKFKGAARGRRRGRREAELMCTMRAVG